MVLDVVRLSLLGSILEIVQQRSHCWVEVRLRKGLRNVIS